MADPEISLDRVSKLWNGTRAVDDISFDVERGEVFALLGPNGAGKTTSIEVLEGSVPTESGAVTLFIDPLGRPLSPMSLAGVNRRGRRRDRRR